MTMLTPPPVLKHSPAYADVKTYVNHFGTLFPWEGDDWISTCRSWAESCYIHTGISGIEVVMAGPDAQKMLSDISINNVYKWKNGTCKHLVQCDEEGLVCNHSLTVRDSEDSFRSFGMIPYGVFKLGASGKYDVSVSANEVFIFQCSGPKSLTVLEKALQQNFHDVKFLECRPICISGFDAQLEICRIGMSGTLAYEIHGPAELAPQVYDLIYQTGKPVGMKRLGWRAYGINHIFGGFPQHCFDFETAFHKDPEYRKEAPFALELHGSVESENLRARFATPGDLGWSWMAKFDHDFVGREVVEEEAKNPKRKLVTLVWNVEDLLDIYASLFQAGEPYKYFELPLGAQHPFAGSADYVTTMGGEKIGISSHAAYGSYYRQVVSQCVMDIEHAVEGQEVLVQWGDYGKRIKNVRATISRYPYGTLVRNEDYDLSLVPSGLEE